MTAYSLKLMPLIPSDCRVRNQLPRAQRHPKTACTHLQHVVPSQGTLTRGDERARVVAETTSIRQRRTAEFDTVEIVEHEQIERVSLVVNKVGPVVPEPRKVDGADKVSADGLSSPRCEHPRPETRAERVRTIQKPLRNDAIASEATKIGRTAATTADCERR